MQWQVFQIDHLRQAIFVVYRERFSPIALSGKNSIAQTVVYFTLALLLFFQGFNYFSSGIFIIESVYEIAISNNVKFDQEQFDRSEDLIRLYAKAYIARSVWDNEGFYPVINQNNEILQYALELFDEAELMAKN